MVQPIISIISCLQVFASFFRPPVLVSCHFFEHFHDFTLSTIRSMNSTSFLRTEQCVQMSPVLWNGMKISGPSNPILMRLEIIFSQSLKPSPTGTLVLSHFFPDSADSPTHFFIPSLTPQAPMYSRRSPHWYSISS